MAQTHEIEQGLGRFLSCGARKPEKTLMDLLIIADPEPQPSFMTYNKYSLTVASKLKKAIYRLTEVRIHGHRRVRPTPQQIKYGKESAISSEEITELSKDNLQTTIAFNFNSGFVIF